MQQDISLCNRIDNEMPQKIHPTFFLYMRVSALVLLSSAWMLVSVLSAFALPQYTLLTGNKCLNCHVNVQGGGLRNELGWYMEKDMKLLPAHTIGLKFLDDAESNSIADGNLTLGFDVRMQLTRSPRSERTETRVIPMQTAIYAAWQAASWLTIEGMADIGSLYRQIAVGSLTYAGQQAWSASVLLQPSYALPQLRLGHFQPSIGMRYDDHTMLVRQVAGANGTTLIPPNYAEWGAELNYDGLQWLTLTAGAFLPRSLAQNQSINQFGESIPLLNGITAETGIPELLRRPSLLARAVVWPRTEDHQVNMYAGASVLSNATFSLVNGFAGIGLSDRFSLMGEYALSGVKDGRQTRNYSVEFMYRAFSGALPYIRYERGTTLVSAPSATSGIEEWFATQIILGVQLFPIPFVELRPELRYYDTEAYRATRFNLQLHLYY
jgi:hypothetical protein